MKIQSKIATCVSKIMEAAQACEELNSLQEDYDAKVQAVFLLDTGKKVTLQVMGPCMTIFQRTNNLVKMKEFVRRSANA